MAEILYPSSSADPSELLEKLSKECLTKFVELTMNNKLGRPLRLAPFQQVILYLLWNYKFPLILAPRGSGKSFLIAVYALLRALLCPGSQIIITGSVYRQGKIVMEYVEKLINMSPLIQEALYKHERTTKGHRNAGVRYATDKTYVNVGAHSSILACPVGDGCVSPLMTMTYEDGLKYIGDEAQDLDNEYVQNRMIKLWSNEQFRESDQFYYNGEKPTIKIRTRQGYFFEGTYNHRIKILRNQEIVWCRLDEIRQNDYVLIDRSIRWPTKINDVDESEAYSLGLMTGDGCWTNGKILRFASVDHELIPKLNQAFDKDFVTCGDQQHHNLHGMQHVKNWLSKWDMPVCYAHEKYIPNRMLSAPKKAMSAFLAGLYDTDGHVTSHDDPRGGTSISITLTSTSEKLIDQVQLVLLHYGIISHKSWRDRNPNWRRCYSLLISGKDVGIFCKEIGFKLKRKCKQIQDALRKKKILISLEDHIPNVLENMIQIAKENRIKRGTATKDSTASSASKLTTHKKALRHRIDSFIRAYSFTKDPFISVLKELNNHNIYYDQVQEIDFGFTKTYDLHIPDGNEYSANGFFSHNSRIRGLRATHLICDETASIDPNVIDIVISPFLSSPADPEFSSAIAQFVRKLEKLGASEEVIQFVESQQIASNQLVLTGTATFQFNHFYRRYCIWKAFAESKGNIEAITKAIALQNPDPRDRAPITQKDVSLYKKIWKEHVIFQLPYEGVPEGFLDDAIVAMHKAQMPPTIFGHEYQCIFSKDTDGFFKRSVIYDATPQIGSPDAAQLEVYGEPGYDYVMGLDPARHNDNFGLDILKLDGPRSKFVYCDTWNKTDFPESTRRIREVMRRFPNIVHIAMDAGGGGQTIADLLLNKDFLQPGEHPITQINDESTIHIPNALRILELVNFHTWNVSANYDLLSDIKARRLLFPSQANEEKIFKQTAKAINKGNPLTQQQIDFVRDRLYGEINIEEDKMGGGVLDNINQTIDELCAIERSVTEKGTETFGLPKLQHQPEGLDVRRRDRYSALLLAAYAARVARGTGFEPEKMQWDQHTGGIAGHFNVQGQRIPARKQGPVWF